MKWAKIKPRLLSDLGGYDVMPEFVTLLIDLSMSLRYGRYVA